MMYATSDNDVGDRPTPSTSSRFHWLKMNYLILIVALWFLFHVNFFQEYSDEPYVGSHMNTAHGSTKHHVPTRNNQTSVSSNDSTKPSEVEKSSATKPLATKPPPTNPTDKAPMEQEHADTEPAHTKPPLDTGNLNATNSPSIVQVSSSTSFIDGMDPKKVKLSDLIDTKTYQVKADLSNMIDFATIGNPKTGTSFMSQWFRKHPELVTPRTEMRAMKWPTTGPGRSVEIMFPLLKEMNAEKKLGYKCPADVREMMSLQNLRDFFPKAKLIVGIRHPVLWFESFHNYRIRRGTPIPNPMQCRGKCHRQHQSVCTYSGYFHLFLAQMGLTSMSTRKETNLLRHYDITTLKPLPFEVKALQPPMPQEVFLYETTQIDGSKVPHIAETFRRDLSAYLQLETPLASLASAKPVAHHVNASSVQTEETKLVGELFDICDPKYKVLRDELILIGRDAAQWILDYFVPLPNVHVSSPEFFHEVLEGYGSDPCPRGP